MGEQIGFESRTPGGLSIFSNKNNIVHSDHISDSGYKLKFTQVSSPMEEFYAH